MVPLTIPMTRWMRSPVSDSRSARTRGMAPATAASYNRSTPRSRARVRRATPSWDASSALLAVTTGRPASRAARTSAPAGSSPPISSTTMSTSGSATRAAASVVSSARGTWSGRGASRSWTAIPAMSNTAPDCTASAPARLWRIPTRAAPTLPQPRTATRRCRSVDGAEVTRSRYRLGTGVPVLPRRAVGPGRRGQTSKRTRSSRVSRRTTVRASPSATKTTAGRGTLL